MKTQEKYRNILRKMPMNCIKQAEERNLLNLLTETKAAKSAYFLISSRKCIWKQICNKRTYFSTAEETSAKACLCTAENVRMILPQSLKLLLCLQQWSIASGRTWDLGETLPLPQKLAPEMWLYGSGSQLLLFLPPGKGCLQTPASQYLHHNFHEGIEKHNPAYNLY